MSKIVAFLIWLGIFIFIAPVCVMAGTFGGCLFGAMVSPVSDQAAGFAMGIGGLLGLGGSIVIPILVVRGIQNSQRRRDYAPPQY